MLGRNLITVLCRRNNMAVTQSAFHVPKRNWAQVGIVISTPPRVPVSFGEKLMHSLFMMVVWFTPVAYFMSQIKVWRRLYVEN